MTTEPRETDEPNEFGFAGGATAPEPEPDTRTAEQVDGERIAIPDGDLTGAVTQALDETIARDDES